MTAPFILDGDALDAQSWLLDRLDDLFAIFRMCDGRPRIHPVTKKPWTCACPMTTADDCYRDRYPSAFDEDAPSPGDHDYETCECSCHEWEQDDDDSDDVLSCGLCEREPADGALLCARHERDPLS